MKFSTFLAISALCLTPLAASAEGSSPAYSFLETTSSARIYGLGGVNISTVEDDISTVEQNPGLLGPEMSGQLMFNYMRYLGDSNFAGVRYGHSAGENAAWSAAIQYFGYGKIQGADASGILTNTFSPVDVAFSGTYSHNLSSTWRGGITLKMLYSSYEQYSAFAIATDLGVNYFDEDHDFSFSAVVANLGGQVKRFNEHYDRLPFDIRLGFTKGLGSLPMRLSVTAWNLTKWNLPYYHTELPEFGDTSGATQEVKESFASNLFRHLVFGLDIVPSEKLYLSVGYNYKQRTDMVTFNRNFLSGWSLGAGLNVSNFGLGLALSQPHSGATTFMVNLRLNLADILH